MSASQMALRGHIAQLEQDNIELRLALARTTKQLAETLEEYKLLRVPFFRRWRMRRLMRRRAAEQVRALKTQPDLEPEKPCQYCGGNITREPGIGLVCRVCVPSNEPFGGHPPLIIVPGR